MYSIDNMIEPMVEALFSARAAGTNEKWMAANAFWLSRQLMYGESVFFTALAGKITSLLPEAEKTAISDQLKSSELAAVTGAPTEWPATPDSITSMIASWSPVPVPVDLAAYTAAKRYAVETGGVAFGGTSIKTDRESQALITGAYVYVQKNPTAVTEFKDASGAFVDLTADQVSAMADAVGAHVQASFGAEKIVAAAITAGTITTTAEIDAAAWPSNT